MAAKNVGTLILEGRTDKKLSQTALAEKVGTLSGSDIGKAERGEKELTQTQLKAIAKVLGVTQKSLLEAPKGGTGSSASKKTSSAAAKTKKKTAAVGKTSTAAVSARSLSTSEKKLIELYRAASSDSKKLATRILKGDGLELGDVLPILMNNGAGGDDGILGSLLGKVQDLMK